MGGNEAGAVPFFCGPLASALDDGSVGFNPSRRSFKLRVLIDRQRPMKNVTLYRATVLQLDANGTDSTLDAAADCHVLRNDGALDLCAIADLEIRGADFAFDSAEDLRWTFAIDVADDRHVGAD